MTRITVGIDLSYTNTGFAVLRDGVFSVSESTTIGTAPAKPPRRHDRILRAQRISGELHHKLDALTWSGTNQGNPDASLVDVFIEDYAYASFANREAMGELGGVVKERLLDEGYDFRTLPISFIRKLVCGKGNARKDQVMVSLYKRFEIDVTQHDLADATAAALAGDHLVVAQEHATEMDRWRKEDAETLRTFMRSKHMKDVA